MKKHLVYSFLLVAGLALITSCSKSDESLLQKAMTMGSESMVKIVESNVIFDANGNTGTIVFTAPGPVSVTSSAAWAVPTLSSGNIVTVAVEPNPYSTGRTAKITLSYALYSTSVIVQQRGTHLNDRLSDILCGDTAYSRTYPIPFEGDAKIWVENNADWVNVTTTKESLTVNVAANPTPGVERAAWVYYQVGIDKDSLYVNQFDFDNHFLGDYAFTYYNSGWKYVKATLVKEGDDFYLENATWSANGWRLPVEVDTEDMRMTIWSTDYCGQYQESDVRVVLLGTNGTSAYILGSSYAITAQATKSEGGTWLFDFELNNTSTYGYYALRFYTYDGSTRGSNLIAYSYAYLEKL